MEPESRYTAIGAALLVLILALAGAAVWLTRSGARADVRHYTVYFERQSLQGLQVGSGVEMRGIVDRAIVLAGGTVIADGTVPQVMRVDHPWLRSYFAHHGT